MRGVDFQELTFLELTFFGVDVIGVDFFEFREEVEGCEQGG